MADDIQGLPPGAVVKPIAPPTSAPTGGVEGLPADAVVSPIASQNTEPVQRGPEYNDPTKNPTGNPDYYPGEGAIARGATSAYRAMGGGALGDTNEEVKNRLKEIATHPVDKTLEFGKGVLDQQGELAAKAKDAWKKGDHVGAAAYALYYLLPGIGPSLAKSGEQFSSGDVAGGVGTAAGTALPAVAGEAATPESTVPKSGFKAATEQASREAVSRESTIKPTTQSVSAAETAPKAEPLKAAGEAVQKEAAATREAAGKKVGAAKESVVKSLPKNITPDSEYIKRVIDEKAKTPAKGFAQNPYEGKEFADLSPDQQATVTKEAQQLKTAETGQIPFPKKGNLAKASQAVLKDVESSQKLAGIKDPDMADVEKMATHLSKGLDADGNDLSANPKEADSIKRAFDQKIDALQSKAQAGGNATALRHVKNLKTAFNDDLFDAYEQHGDPTAAQNLRAANKEFAGIVADQTSGPARKLFKNQSPEKIVSSVVNSGARTQSAVESLVKNMSDSGKQTLRDSVLKEIYRQSEMSDGSIDMVKARRMVYRLGDTAKVLYGDDLKPVTDYMDAASKEQASRVAKAQKTPIGKQVLARGAKIAGAGVGSAVAGVPGAIVGDVMANELTDAFFQNGKSGAVKIGISPTEKIVLSPTQATAARPLITKFLKAKAAGNPAAVASAYNAIANPQKQNNQ